MTEKLPGSEFRGTKIHISVEDGPRQLTISGPLDLFVRLLEALGLRAEQNECGGEIKAYKSVLYGPTVSMENEG